MTVQDVTVAPFRVVDEINQGMDQINERKVFTLLVEAACKPGTPQCFMFTPKLLPDLPYTPDVMPMLILNGSHIADVTQGFRGVVRSIAKPYGGDFPPMLAPCNLHDCMHVLPAKHRVLCHACDVAS